MQTHTRTHCTNAGTTRFSSFIANSSPVLIKKLPQPRTSCWGNKEVIMFLNGLQLGLISLSILKLFAVLTQTVRPTESRCILSFWSSGFTAGLSFFNHPPNFSTTATGRSVRLHLLSPLNGRKQLIQFLLYLPH